MRWRELVGLICPTAKAKCFLREGWTTQISMDLFKKLDFSRHAPERLYGRHTRLQQIGRLIGYPRVRSRRQRNSAAPLTNIPSKLAADAARGATVDKHARRGIHLSSLNNRRNGPPRPIVFTSRCCEASAMGGNHEEVHARTVNIGLHRRFFRFSSPHVFPLNLPRMSRLRCGSSSQKLRRLVPPL